MTEESKPSLKDRITAGARVAHERLSEAKAKSEATFKFSGITLTHDGRIESRQGGGSVAGASASVETLGQIRGRRTVKTLGLHQKKIDEREAFLSIEGIGWAISVQVDPKDGAAAREFAARVNGVAKKPAES